MRCYWEFLLAGTSLKAMLESDDPSVDTFDVCAAEREAVLTMIATPATTREDCGQKAQTLLILLGSDAWPETWAGLAASLATDMQRLAREPGRDAEATTRPN